MLILIKNILLGYKVCGKFNVNFKPYKRVNYSPASFQVDDNGYTIWCDITDRMFIPSLFHELAHCIDYKHTKFKRKIVVKLDHKRMIENLSMTDREYSQVLASEVRANKYAVRFLKSAGLWCIKYQEDLECAMTTYITYVDKLNIADFHYNIMKYLRGIK